MEKKDIKKKFPKLFKEIESGINSVEIEGIRWVETEKNELTEPDIFSFLRRCETEEEGYNIINYLEKKKEITQEMADDLRQQIKSRGIRSFGKKKEWGYYENKFNRDNI